MKKSVTELATLLAQELPPLIALTGPEEFLRREALHDILVQRHGDPLPPEDLSTLAPERNKVDARQLTALFDELHTPSLFGGNRTVIVERAQAFLEADAEAWLALLARGWQGSLLVLQLESLDGRTKLAKAIVKHGWVLEAAKPFHRPPPWKPRAAPWDNPLNQWICARARREGLSLEPSTAHLLQTRIGTSLSDLAGVLDRLGTVLSGTGKVTRELVEQHTPAGEESDVFELVDVILLRDRPRALTLARELLTRGTTDAQGNRVTDPSGLLMQFNGTLLRRLRQLRSVHEVQSRGGDEAEILQASGISKFLWPRISQQARATDPPRIARLVAAARRVDRDLKTTSGVRPQELIERMALQ